MTENPRNTHADVPFEEIGGVIISAQTDIPFGKPFQMGLVIYTIYDQAAETGYHAYFNMLERNELMPGLKQGVGYIKRDESRHLAYGVFLISRLVAQDKSLWPFVEEQMNTLLIPALGVVTELYEGTEEIGELPFGLKMEEYLSYATMQFSKRMARIERAREQTLEQLYQLPEIEPGEE